MIRGSKHALYSSLRAQGLRLYAPRSNLLASSPCVCNIKRHYNPELNEDIGKWTKFKENMGFRGKLMYYPSTLRYAGFRLYLSASAAARYNRINDYIVLPDTMASWHKLTSLHVWLIMSRLTLEGREGSSVRTGCVKTFYSDTKEQAKRVGDEMKTAIQMDHIDVLNQSLWGAILSYDEGLLGSDKELAGALWRCLFSSQADVDPVQLETMVLYIRKQVAHLQRIPSRPLLTNGLIPFLPVEGNRVKQSAYDWLEEVKRSKVTVF